MKKLKLPFDKCEQRTAWRRTLITCRWNHLCWIKDEKETRRYCFFAHADICIGMWCLPFIFYETCTFSCFSPSHIRSDFYGSKTVWNHGNLFQTCVVRATEGQSCRQVRRQISINLGMSFRSSINNGILSVVIRMVSSQRGDSNECTQHTFAWKKRRKFP